MSAFSRLATTVALLAATGVVAPSLQAANFVVTPPFKIQQAVAAALASADEEDIIFVNPGTYDEEVIVDFTGTNQTLLYFAHNTSVRPLITGGVRIENSRLVTFDGFAIRSSKTDTKAAAVVSDTVGAAFVQCIFDGGDFGGIDADNSFEIVVNTCQFGPMDESASDTGGFGVRIQGLCGHKITDCSFEDDEGRSIWLSADRSDVIDCEVDGAGGDAGIYLNGLGNSVKNSIVKNNEGDGVRVIGTAEVKDSSIQNNSGAGIRFGINDGNEWTGGAARKNTIKGNDGGGILIDTSHGGVDVRSNTLTSNSGAGIRIRSDGNGVKDNTIQKTTSGSSGGNGVLIESNGDRNCIRENTFSGNSGHAVRVEGDDNYVLLNDSKDSDGYIDDGSGNAGRDNDTSGPNEFD